MYSYGEDVRAKDLLANEGVAKDCVGVLEMMFSNCSDSIYSKSLEKIVTPFTISRCPECCFSELALSSFTSNTEVRGGGGIIIMKLLAVNIS